MNEKKLAFFATAGLICIITLVTAIAFISYPISLWTAKYKGKAAYVEAEQNRQITTLEAKAKKESAIFLAEAEVEKAQALAKAEVIRAKGVAEANKIIGESLQGNEAYLRYRWIEGLQTNQMQVVYVPTEGGLPLLEAGKRP